ncbi:terminase small subunit [Buttiauxella sp. 3AFRM03]|nr:terminase small subunit [Buttiauxella sp. 3AFRM03]
MDAWRLFYIDVLRQRVPPGHPLNKPANEPANEGDEQGDDIEREIRLQEARIRLTEAQALAQELKNLRDERVVVDTAFCSFALSRLANDIASILDSIPLSMQRRFVDIDKAQLEFLKKLIAKAMNNATATSGKIPEMLDEYIDSTS